MSSMSGNAGDTQQTQYPKAERGELVDATAIESYLACLFGAVRYQPNHFINVRGIGEKGTDREGVFQEDCWAQPGVTMKGVDPDEALAADVHTWSRVWAQHNVASYIVPAVLKEARGSSSSVALMPAAVVDLDTGDTRAKAAYLIQHLGEPSMAVKSGGITELGTPKLHLYWVFREPSADIARVVDLRHEIAAKVGGDLQFGRGTPDNPYGRAHQPIRIAGTVHSKKDAPAVVELAKDDPSLQYELDELVEAARRMPPSPWAVTDSAPERTAGMLDFGAFSPDAQHGGHVQQALATVVHEGGEDRTRWGEFNKVAGFHLNQVRRGELTLEQAKADTVGWVLAKMDPPWPVARIEREFNALLAVDENRKGAMPVAALEPSGTIVEDVRQGLHEHAVYNWVGPRFPVPKRKFLVEGLVQGGKTTLLVAEGGAGKTFSMLDLCLKIGGLIDGEELDWWGKPVTAEPGGSVVMLTTEDDRDELHIRLAEIDPGAQRITQAGNRLMIVPAVNTPRGPFAFVERDKHTGSAVASAAWREFMGWLMQIQDLRMVVVDTLNTTMHGNENDATTVNEYAKALAPLSARGVATLVTHHIRKPDPKAPIMTADDMLAAVRGSSALPSAFRAVLGVWAHPDYAKALKALGEPVRPKALWNLAVLNANNPEMMPGVAQLLRNERGVLEEVSQRLRGAFGSDTAKRKAWLSLAVRLAADAGAPFKHTKKDGRGGVYARRNQLPPELRESARGLEQLVESMVDAGELVVVDIDWMDSRRKARRWATLDVPDGSIAGATHNVIVNDAAIWAMPEWSEWVFDDSLGSVRPLGAPVMQL